MKIKLRLNIATTRSWLAIFATFYLAIFSTSFAQDPNFTYQGRLDDNGAPANGVYDFRFSIYNGPEATATSALSLTEVDDVATSNGLFTVQIPAPTWIFNGEGRWLAIEVRTNATGAFTLLSPWTEITPTPYAVRAFTVTSDAFAAGFDGTVSFTNPSNVFTGSFTGDGGALSNVVASTLGGLSASNFWQLGGNAGTAAGPQFLGTTDNQPLELKVNNTRGLRLEYASSGGAQTVNVIGGCSGNFVGSGVLGATIWGGANHPLGSLTNRILSNFGTVGGGFGNAVSGVLATVSGGSDNTAGDFNATVGGGYTNTASGNSATVSGGGYNIADSNSATVSGGHRNTASDSFATVSGGYGNTASGYSATVSGGYSNSASGTCSFAAGKQAKAIHSGSFVWADNIAADFASTDIDQFLIRASGGVGIGTTVPTTSLEVVRTFADNTGQIIVRHSPAEPTYGWLGAGSDYLVIGANNVAPGRGIAFQVGTNSVSAEKMRITEAGRLGIGTAAPAYQLQLSTDSAGKPNGGSWANSSDRRLKHNIAGMTNALERLTQLRGVTFEWIHPEDHAGQHGPQGGFIAQEVEAQFPNWVTPVPAAEHDRALTDDGNIKSLSLPFEFDALVVEAIKEQQSRIDARDRKITELTREVAELKRLMSQLNSHFAGDPK